MKELCERDESTSHVTLGTKGSHETVDKFRKKFLKEARSIASLNHPNIIRIIDVFEENGTAYYVMEYVDGESLASKVKREGALSQTEALQYINDVGAALSYIHYKSINHLDVKPANIMLSTTEKRAYLIDFGVSKQYDVETNLGTTTTPVGISHGYSPAEQYRQGGVQSFSPQSDVYSLAATLYKLLTGITPPEPADIEDQGIPLQPLRDRSVSENVIKAIVAALKTRSKRTPSIAAFLKNVNNASTAYQDDEEETEITDVTNNDSHYKQDKQVKTVNSNYRQVVETLMQGGNNREAYEACLKAVHEGSSDEWLKTTMAELVVLMRKERKKSDHVNVWIAIGLTVGGLILAILYYSS